MIPTFIELNPTELCNLKCNFCPRADEYPNSNLHMTLDTVDVVVDHIKQLASFSNRNIVVSYTGRGEPTLQKNFVESMHKLIDLRNEVSNVRLLVNTNGYKFDKYIDIYKQIDTVAFNVYYNYTYDDYLQFKEKYKSLSNVFVKRRKEGEESEQVNYNSRSGAILVENLTDVISSDKHYGYCNKPFGNIFIDWNGDYILCCNDWVIMEPLDNVHNTSIIDFYNYNTKLQKYKKMLSQHKRIMSPCNTCNYYSREH